MRQHTFCTVFNFINLVYIYCRKAFGEYCDISIAIDYEMKLKIYFISSFWLILFEHILEYVYIIYLLMSTVRTKKMFLRMRDASGPVLQRGVIISSILQFWGLTSTIAWVHFVDQTSCSPTITKIAFERHPKTKISKIFQRSCPLPVVS